MMSSYKVLLFYRFFGLEDLDSVKEKINELCLNRHLMGRILLANEGINGTLAGWDNQCDDIIKDLEQYDIRFKHTDWKVTTGMSVNHKLPFPDLYIKVVKELIGTGLLGKDFFDRQTFSNDTYGGLDKELTGVHLTPQEWHHALQTFSQLPSDYDNKSNNSTPETNNADIEYSNKVLLDVRNDIEYQVGHFQGSTNLKVKTYAESWKSIDKILNETRCDNDPKSKIFMYCTGGIRCEKASAYLIKKGIERERIFHLEGGIHRYLEQYPDGGMFQGKNFVFDERVVTAPSEYQSCSTNISDSNTGVENTVNINNVVKINDINRSNIITGKCAYCDIPYDLVHTDRICCVCRNDVLCCDTCFASKSFPGEYHCLQHWYLKECYHTNLEGFNKNDLIQQRFELQKISDSLIGTKEKNKRRLLRNQITKIQIIVDQILFNERNKFICT